MMLMQSRSRRNAAPIWYEFHYWTAFADNAIKKCSVLCSYDVEWKTKEKKKKPFLQLIIQVPVQ